MRKSLLALAVSLAAASGAHAAWDNGSATATGNGELLLAVWDTNASHQTSVAIDLGTKFSTFDANLTNTAFTQSYNLDATALTAAFGTSNLSDLRYSIIAITNDLTAAGPGAPSVLVTSNISNPAMNSVNVGNVVSASVAAASAVNTDSNFAANLATVGTIANGRYLGVPSAYGNNFTAGSVPFAVTDLVSKSLAFYEFNSSDLTGTPDVKAVGKWSINLSNLSAGTLTYSAAPAVPVPAAAWLMGSALAGLGSIARRRRRA